MNPNVVKGIQILKHTIDGILKGHKLTILNGSRSGSIVVKEKSYHTTLST